MAQEPEDGRRFARDMRRIREARNLALSDLHDETKIPQGLIEAFEDKALFDHPQFNRVYLRSFVRTYAQVVEIDAEVALEGLEDALSGRYAGSLAVTYLGEEPDEHLAEREADDESEASLTEEMDSAAVSPAGGGSTEETEENEEVTEAEEAIEPDPEPEAEPEAVRKPRAREKRARRKGDDVPREEEDEDGRRPYVSTTQDTAAGYQQSMADQEVADVEAEEDWTAQSPPSGVAHGTAARRPRSDGPDRRWILGGAIVVAVAALVWIMMSVVGSSDEPAPVPVTTADTAETVETPDTMPPLAQPIDVPLLGDTIDVRIVAARGAVDPIRVTVDDDLRRPYWIEDGDSMTFRPTTRIVIEELLENVDVKLEGIEYPGNRRDEQGRIVVTRDTVENYFNSLRQVR